VPAATVDAFEKLFDGVNRAGRRST
jgi:hypothetical protein